MKGKLRFKMLASHINSTVRKSCTQVEYDLVIQIIKLQKWKSNWILLIQEEAKIIKVEDWYQPQAPTRIWLGLLIDIQVWNHEANKNSNIIPRALNQTYFRNSIISRDLVSGQAQLQNKHCWTILLMEDKFKQSPEALTLVLQALPHIISVRAQLGKIVP